ncbi:MAG: IS200/IS605 family transposase [Pirellulales bacterium]
MSRNYYSEIHLHLVWHTKLSRPLLSPQIEQLAYRALRHKIVEWPGAFVHELGGTETHVHLAVTIAPTVPISEFVGQLKGASSHEVNQQAGRGAKVLEWQTGYGVVSFGTKDLAWVNEYVHNQKEHHATGRIHDRLERVTAEEVVPAHAAEVAQVAQAHQREVP